MESNISPTFQPLSQQPNTSPTVHGGLNHSQTQKENTWNPRKTHLKHYTQLSNSRKIKTHIYTATSNLHINHIECQQKSPIFFFPIVWCPITSIINSRKYWMCYFYFLYFLDNQTEKTNPENIKKRKWEFDGWIEGFFNGLLVDLSLGFPSYCCFARRWAWLCLQSHLRWVVNDSMSKVSGGERNLEKMKKR